MVLIIGDFPRPYLSLGRTASSSNGGKTDDHPQKQLADYWPDSLFKLLSHLGVTRGDHTFEDIMVRKNIVWQHLVSFRSLTGKLTFHDLLIH